MKVDRSVKNQRRVRKGHMMENLEIDTPLPGWKGAKDAARAGKRGFSTQLIIFALVAIFVLPGILFSALLLNRYAESERVQYQLEGRNAARTTATVLDRYLSGLRITLQTLAASVPLASGDMESFHEQATRVKTLIKADITLRRPDGRQIIRTDAPWNTPLPPVSRASDAQVIASGLPVISDVFIESASGRPMVAIVLPVMMEGELKYLLDINVGTDTLRDAIKDVIPSNWLIGIGDRVGTYVTRSRNHAEFSGKPGVPAFLARAVGDEGAFTGESAFGEKVLVGYTRSAFSHWLIAASIKQEVIEAPLKNALYILITFGVLMLAVASLIALWLWRFIARPLEALTAASRHVGDMRWIVPVKTPLREFVAVGDALHAAAQQVRSITISLRPGSRRGRPNWRAPTPNLSRTWPSARRWKPSSGRCKRWRRWAS